MRVVEQPSRVVRIRIDEMENGKNLPGCYTIHLADTTAESLQEKVSAALGVPLDGWKIASSKGESNAERKITKEAVPLVRKIPSTPVAGAPPATMREKPTLQREREGTAERQKGSEACEATPQPQGKS